MFKLVSEADQKRADVRAVANFGYPSVLLMEQASAALAARISGLCSGAVVLLAGPGNNGGDAWGVARYLHLQGRKVHVVVWEEPRTPEALAFAHMARSLGIPEGEFGSPRSRQALQDSSLWIDGIYGAGFRPPVRTVPGRSWGELLALRDRPGLTVVAIDVPSGLSATASGSDAVLRADVTLSPGWRKPFCYHPGLRAFCGRTEELPLGYPEAVPTVAEGLEPGDLDVLLPRTSREAHKGTRGRVLLVGGSEGMAGALVLASRSSAAAGAGLVGLWTDEDVVRLVAGQVPAFQVRSFSSRGEDRKPEACVVGPGWGREEARIPQLRNVLDLGVPTVIDADGLVAWTDLRKSDYKPEVPRRLVLTPHPGEMRQLLGGESPTWERARSFSENEQVTLILKDSTTWIFSPGQLPAVWDGQNPSLGTGGSGDCLAGILGGLLAQGLEPSRAARAGVLLHAHAGEELAGARGWFTADELPAVIARRSWRISES